jgi:hypothetical protein
MVDVLVLCTKEKYWQIGVAGEKKVSKEGFAVLTGVAII